MRILIDTLFLFFVLNLYGYSANTEVITYEKMSSMGIVLIILLAIVLLFIVIAAISFFFDYIVGDKIDELKLQLNNFVDKYLSE